MATWVLLKTPTGSDVAINLDAAHDIHPIESGGSRIYFGNDDSVSVVTELQRIFDAAGEKLRLGGQR